MFEKVTKHMSSSRAVLVHQVIPVLDRLTAALELVVDDQSKPLSICHGAKNVLKVVDKYYSCTDDSHIYRVAMIMHPRYKLDYFHAKEWPQDWIDMALSIACQIWCNEYKKQGSTENIALYYTMNNCTC
ncbi:hypothetical protein K439DRAFT_1328930 [Ramaria rubella]|nr:hypothetical protein K439DRAFT_1328930 [Ramaria rubella]